MNDIEILEEYLDKQEGKFVSENRLMILQAIENLIARNKELEEMIGTLNFAIKKHYIPKSKVKEKIKELKNECEKCYNNHLFCEYCLTLKALPILQKLLED